MCDGYNEMPRHFLTNEEKISLLDEYRKDLELEIKAVGEKIDKLKKNN